MLASMSTSRPHPKHQRCGQVKFCYWDFRACPLHMKAPKAYPRDDVSGNGKAGHLWSAADSCNRRSWVESPGPKRPQARHWVEATRALVLESQPSHRLKVENWSGTGSVAWTSLGRCKFRVPFLRCRSQKACVTAMRSAT